MNNKIVVYVAGPITTDANGPVSDEQQQQNVAAMIRVTNDLLDMGYIVICPALTYYLDRERHRSHEEWLAYCKVKIDMSDTVFWMDLPSLGTIKDVAYAREVGRMVFTTYQELQRVAPADMDEREDE